MQFKAAIFDVDGVITNTAKLHFECWKITFDDYLLTLSKMHKILYISFSQDDYLKYVDGVSRSVGIKNFLASRGIKISSEVIFKISNRKTKLFLQKIKQEGVTVFNDTIQLIKQLKSNHIKIAAVSASKNCRKILNIAGVKNLFDIIVDGNRAAKLGLKSKPSPDIFLLAVQKLQAQPQESLVIEDALQGIEAAKKGNFGLVIALDRWQNRSKQFKTLSADFVVNNLFNFNFVKLKRIFSYILPSALFDFAEIRSKLNNKKLLLGLDFDGTIAPIVKAPSLAKIDNAIFLLLKNIKNFIPLAIISGRQINDLMSRVKLNNIFYAGNHGFEMNLPRFFPEDFTIGSEYQDDILKLHHELNSKLNAIKGCILENKKFSLSVHYRLVEAKQQKVVKDVVNKVLKKYFLLKKNSGKKVLEIKPNLKWHKGKALKYVIDLLESGFKEDICPIYIGDDRTDEDAFKQIFGKGIAIIVGKKTSKMSANYHLLNTKEVYYFLKLLSLFLKNKTIYHYQPDWILTYSSFVPKEQGFREALCTLSNGFSASRAAFEESFADNVHYPGNYFAGIYNQSKSNINYQSIVNEDLVNNPNWLALSFKIEKENWFNISSCEILAFKQTLYLQQGILYRHIRFKDACHRITQIEFVKFLSLTHPHIAASNFKITAENWSGRLIIKSGLEGNIINQGVARYKQLNNQHLIPTGSGEINQNTLYLVMKTTTAKIKVIEIANHQIFHQDKLVNINGSVLKNKKSIFIYYRLNIKKNNTLELQKIVYLNYSVRYKTHQLIIKSVPEISKASYRYYLDLHIAAWKKYWQQANISILSYGNEQKIILLYTFHLLQTLTKHTAKHDIGIPARGWHGEAYRGHVFWDELFILPFYILRFPDIAKSLLIYRYRRLSAARKLAKKSGFKGAMYPWQSATTGEEVSQIMHLNPDSQQWEADYSCYQRHINGAIVYNIWQYYLFTDDIEFIKKYGAEIILEIARFWGSLSVYNQTLQRYEIKGVVGPDEFHEQYPDSNKPGINNNAYTNFMAVWSLERANEIIQLLKKENCQELLRQLNITSIEIKEWKKITKKMFIPFHNKNIISQFSGYEVLSELNWEYYRRKYTNIERLDRILKSEGNSANNYKISKQADVLMLFYLFPFAELKKIFEQLKYPFDEIKYCKNMEYYEARTSHGSSLSHLVFAFIFYHRNPEKSWQYYQKLLATDFKFTEYTTTHEGIHLAAMAGSINFITYCLTGLTIKNKCLSFNPKLSAHCEQIKFKINYLKISYTVMLDSKFLSVKINKGKVSKIYCKNKFYKLIEGKWLTILL